MRHMDIAEAANSLKAVFITQNLTLAAMLHPGAPVLNWYREISNLPQDADMHVDLPMRDTDELVRFSAKQAFENIQALPNADIRRDLLAGPILLGATRIGYLLERHGLNRQGRPLTQFARHFRNAAAHGDQWYFKGEEPKNPAYTRDVKLDPSLDGTRATFHTVGPYEYVMFLDEIAALAGQATFEKVVGLSYRNREGKSLPQIHVDLQSDLEAEGVICSDPSIQYQIAHFTTQIFSGKFPEVSVSPTVYPVQGPA